MVIYGFRIKESLDIVSKIIIELLEISFSQPGSGKVFAAVPKIVYPMELVKESKYKLALIEAINAIKFVVMFIK